MAAGFRRLVTGRTPEGKSSFVSEGPPPPPPGGGMQPVWAMEGVPPFGGAADPAASWSSFMPGPGGTRFVVVTIPPRPEGAPPRPRTGPPPAGFEGLFEEAQGRPDMHTTPTVDYVIIVAGEIWLELDDGEQRLVRAGDVVIQNGTRHAWINRGPAPVTMYAILIGTAGRH